MFERLQERFESIIKKVKGHGKLTEDNIKEALRDVRVALLEADVNYKVVKEFLDKVKDKAIGQGVLTSITPGQLFVKIVYDELRELLGGSNVPLSFSGPSPHSIMLIGLQGSGKTTTAGKLALFLKKKGRRPLLVATDVRRPAAIDQLKKLASQINVPFYSDSKLASLKEYAIKSYCDVLIIDTAGRLHIDEELLSELVEQKNVLSPSEVLLVLDGMTGQDAVNIAKAFDEKIGVTGFILTKLDGDARGGAALSIRATVGKPIKFIGTGEKLDAIEQFHPERIASRILGMGDIITLVEKAQEAFEERKAKELERKLKRDEFTLEDFKEQIIQLRKLGSLESVLSMIPGFSKFKKIVKIEETEKELKKMEAIINSMTKKERLYPHIIDGSRRLRIAKGSGTTVQDVNELLRKYSELKKMIKSLSKGSFKGFGSKIPFP
ncbi:MAG: signal recognition particle protein [Desulfobacterota bacterium]|nr:signal recognition particle protein [Thermodesulfobacteriota bacterium]MDW8001514.1 signal recognition particle protein [Deltaproteobacteria bacterium]